MKRYSVFFLGLLFVVGIVLMLGTPTDAQGPELAAPADFPVKLLAGPRTGKSRYHKVRQECFEHHFIFGDTYTGACELVHTHGWALPDEVNLDNALEVGFHGLGDEVQIQVTFNEPVKADEGVTLRLQGWFGSVQPELVLTDADRTDEDETLTFRYTVQAGDREFGHITIDNQNMWHNTRDANWNISIKSSGAKHVKDLDDNNWDRVGFTHVPPAPNLNYFPIRNPFETHLRRFLANKPTLPEWQDGDSRYGTGRATYDAAAARAAAEAYAKYLVDAIKPTVWIAGLIKNGGTHTEDRRNAIVNLDSSVSDPPRTVFTAGVTESVSQGGAFEVEFRFTNHPSATSRTAIAEEIGTTFGAEDIVITDAAGNSLDWTVDAPVYIGLDHRAAQKYAVPNWETDHPSYLPLDHPSYPGGHEPGEAKNSASFLVYKARITPAREFQGDVTIQVPAGATMDIAGNLSKVSNTLTVPVDSVVGTPEIVAPAAGVYTVGDNIEVAGTYVWEHLRYEGANPPYVVLYLGEQVPANARHAVWTAAADAASTRVTFAYTVAATDPVAESVSVPSFKILVPAGTILLFGVGAADGQQSGTDAPAVGSGTAPASVPALDPDVPPVVQTVPVAPLRVVEPPEIVAPPAGAHTLGDKIEVVVTYTQEHLRYEGANPPYVVLYLGEEVLANARHAVWMAAEDTNSTKVTFAYTVAATDPVVETVAVPSVKTQVPAGTILLSGPRGAPTGQQSGTAAPAVASGAAPASVPPADPVPLRDTSGREIPPLVRETPVIPVVPFFPEEASPKAPASEVPRSPVVFNEFGNGSGAANDWLELRNVTGSAVSLKDWELSVVQDDKKEDTSLIIFPDVSVPANGLLLLVSTSPDKTSLAGGEQKGLSHAFLVDEKLSLPDDGKFLLILRNAKEKLGMNEAFVDVAGGGGSDTDAFVREQTGDYDTYVWPLQVREAPGGDTEGALSSGKVWQRAKADIVGYHKDAWAEAAFTGIGYDRTVSKSAATGGTPGYPNGALKTGAATPKGSITISEVMFDSGGGTLPQWIELYNKSKTEALNLNRWELEFQNVDSEDLVGRPIVALTLQAKVIQPNQTLLIVAGPARASSSTAFPAERVYNLLDLHQRNLRIKTARDTFLSAEGFYLKLTDSNGNLVDEVGNTDGNRRTKDAPAWALPVSAEAGVRSSLIRRYDKGVALKGKQRASWALASNVKRLAVSALHYGHAEDIGTPGYRKGGALPVELSSFSVMHNEAGAVVLTWTTESEVDNAGFNLRRSEKRDSGFTLLNPALIAGAGTTGERQTYTFTDTSAKPGVEYYYQIEEVAFDGRPVTLAMRMLRGPVSAANRMLTTFGAVKKQVK